jgi:NADPH:quinone reductase-like Zn-dependent oxidoreductase
MNERMARRVLVLIAVLLIGAAISFALFVSHSSPCGPVPALPANAKLMKAAVARCYGAPDVVRIEDVEKPTPAADEVLVKVHAAAVNPLDWHRVRGTPYYLSRKRNGFGAPREPRLGVDFAGTVEAVGPDVTHFKPGDQVFGARTGAFAEYVVVSASRMIVHMPPNVSFEQAAATNVAAITALQALRDWGHITAGEKVLINGASGGVGTFAVQIAKAYGAQVTGVCSTANVGLVRSIGADRIIDYKKNDFTEGEARYDLIVDMVGNHSLLDLRRVLEPRGAVVIVGSAENRKWFGSMADRLEADVLNVLVSQDFLRMRSDLTKNDLLVVRGLLRTGKVVPIIDRRYGLRELPAALGYLETGRARGKVVIVPE